MKKRIVVVCPGRGSYTKENLGSLRLLGGSEFLSDIDARRKALGEPTISELDSATEFKPAVHTKGEHASALIYACSYADFVKIDRDRYEIVAITGNSMGWYIALALGESLDRASSFEVINSMGSMMRDGIVGGQVIYPAVDEEWRPLPNGRADAIVREIAAREGHEVHTSIRLGGMHVFGANRAGVSALLKELPPLENYPFQLINHAAFHTPLLRDVSTRALESLPPDLFNRPAYPMIDGRGFIWQPHSTRREDLWQYTLGHQVVETYDFTRAIAVALKEFAPDHLVLLGPGSSLGAPVGQIMVANRWRGVESKTRFTKLQAEQPFVLAMGRPDQRALVVS